MFVLVSVATMALLVVTLVDVIRRDDGQIKYLPKVAWAIIIILIPLVGSGLWWAIGRDYGSRTPRSTRYPDHVVMPPRPVDLRTTEQQLADLEREEREERLRAELARRRREKGLDPV